MNFNYKCTECGREYEITPEIMLCPECSQKQEPDKPLCGVLGVSIDGSLDKDFDIFDFLPVEHEFFPDIPVGNTPLWKPVNLREMLGFPNLFIKDDTLNPTASLKDRASYLIAAFARKHGIKDIVVASSGNAGSSMAGVGASAGLNVTLFVPKNAPRAKIIQALQYGARVSLVDGNYDKACAYSREYSKIMGGLNRNTAYNPFSIEGKKTVSLEIFQKLNKAPDFVFVPVGDGVILAAVYKGFRDLKQFGIIDKIPIVYAVQAEGSSAVCRALDCGEFGKPLTSNTIADSVAVDVPNNGYLAVKLLKEYDGKCTKVSDLALLDAQKKLASTAGLFAEPAGAASFAGFLAVRERVPKDAIVVLLVTGNGLKDIDSAAKGVKLPDKPIKSIEEFL